MPSRFIEYDGDAAQFALTASTAPDAFRLTGSVLLVEDSMIIAMDAEEMLFSLGAGKVLTANGVQEAMRLLDAETPTFAFLDVNLGIEMSYAIADRLRLAGVPYVFATGYGDEIELPAPHKGCPVIKKPYPAQMIASGAARAKAED